MKQKTYWLLVIDDNNYVIEDYGIKETYSEALDWIKEERHKDYLEDYDGVQSVIAVPVEGRLNKVEIIYPL